MPGYLDPIKKQFSGDKRSYLKIYADMSADESVQRRAYEDAMKNIMQEQQSQQPQQIYIPTSSITATLKKRTKKQIKEYELEEQQLADLDFDESMKKFKLAKQQRLSSIIGFFLFYLFIILFISLYTTQQIMNYLDITNILLYDNVYVLIYLFVHIYFISMLVMFKKIIFKQNFNNIIEDAEHEFKKFKIENPKTKLKYDFTKF